MKTFLLMLAGLLPVAAFAQKFSNIDIDRYQAKAHSVTIIRDKYGVPHIYGQTDGDVVFGLMYAECEDNFKAVERNYLYQLGRQAEAEGSGRLYEDLQMQLIADSAQAIKEFKSSPFWFKELLHSFADGVNYYLYKHPEVKPLVLKKFEPWYPLMFTDGSVAATNFGGVTLDESQQFYSADHKVGLNTSYKKEMEDLLNEREIGSNGFAIAPSKTANGHAMLWINPHVPFYFRSEVHLVSSEGLNVYGAVTWGQFFVYQGFNEHAGWMHTSSYADVADLYRETITSKDGQWWYKYKNKEYPVTVRKITISYLKDGQLQKQSFDGFYTEHGPVIASRDGKWVSLKANNRSYNALLQSWLITKARNLDEFQKAMDLLSNASNNTVFADSQGNIAFWYGNFVPKRDPKLDWTQPVEGNSKNTEWQGPYALNDIVHVYNPSTGYIQNCNGTPYTSAGAASPDKTQYPAYMAPDGENYRQVLAEKLLEKAQGFTLDSLIRLGYNRHLAAFDVMLPPLFKAYDALPDSLKQPLAGPVKTLRDWNHDASANSVATTLAVEWGTLIMRRLPKAASAEAGTYQTQRVDQFLQSLTPAQLLSYFNEAVNNLTTKYGKWDIAWGDINRYQRPADGVFDDNKPSLPVGLAPGMFGQLPSFVSKQMNNTKKRYGYSGNSFVAAVEFGPKLVAKSIETGGQLFDPSSPHFSDQAQDYIDGKLKDVFFYRADVMKNAERTYHPGAPESK